MVGYSSTLKSPGDINLNPGIKNWVFRIGGLSRSVAGVEHQQDIARHLPGKTVA